MKYTISVEEVLTYNREFTIEVPDSISEDELDSILDRAQSQANKYEDFTSIYYTLEDYRIKVLERADDDTHYPARAEFEITDMDADDGIELCSEDDEDDDLE